MNNNFLMNILNVLVNLIDVLVILLPILLSVAFMTIIERKQLAAMQRRVGPNTVGWKQINLNYLIQVNEKYFYIIHYIK